MFWRLGLHCLARKRGLMPKFSVKKPLTVFVAVIAILVLGVVAYLKMTPDLLPNMDFPYAVVVTSYPGANPETVESEVTKPMEQSMATLDHIKSVSSTSNENYSMVVLQFEDETDMDTIGVDIQQKISALSGSWDDKIGSPYVMKINPSMLPVEVAAVSMEDMDVTELSDFLNDTLTNRLEGVTGVASVSSNGTVDRQMHVTLSQEKMDALSATLTDAINDQMDQAAAQLNATRQQITAAKATMKNAQQSAVQGATDQALTALQNGLDTMAQQRQQQQSQLTKLLALQQKKTQLDQQQAVYDQRIQAIQNDASLTAAEKESAIAAITSSSDYALLQAQQAQLQVELAAAGVTPENLAETIAQTQAALQKLNEQQAALAGGDLTSLSDQISGGVLSLTDAAMQLVSANVSMDAALTQVDQGLAQLETSRAAALKKADLSGTLNLKTITALLTAQNFSMPAGSVKQNDVSYMVSVGDQIASRDELEDLLLFDLGMDGVEPIRIRDVADITVTDNSDEVYAKLDGAPGVIVSFQKQSTFATASVTKEINQRFAELEQEYPGLHFVSLMDQGTYIYMIVQSILQSLGWGALFAVLILLLFLKDLRPTIITLCSIPISVIFAVVLMYFSGVTLNMISLSGLAVAVGMLVDNSVVVIENICRLRAKGVSAIRAAVSGAGQVVGAITASTLTTVCVFLPIVFVEGITKQLFTDLALTMTYALMASLIVALTLVPAMASGMLKKEKPIKPGLLDKIYPVYRRAVDWSLRHKAVILGGALALLLASGALALARGFSYMPTVDMNSVSLTVTMPEDTDRATAEDLADQVQQRIEQLDNVETVGAMMSSGSGMTGMTGGKGGAYNVTMYVTLHEGDSGEAAGKQIAELCSDLPCEVSYATSMMNTDTLSGSGITLKVYGDDMEALQLAASQTADTLKAVAGTEEVDDGLTDAAKAVHIRVDRSAAMKKNLTVAQVYQQVAVALNNSSTAAKLTLDDVAMDVQVELPTESRLTKDTLGDLTLSYTDAAGNQGTCHLSDIAATEDTVSLTSIQRSEQQRYVSVSAKIADGYNVTKVTTVAKEALSQQTMPEGVSYAFDGENENIMESLQQLLLMLLLGILLVYFVMVAQFQSLKSPFIVMFTIPLAFTGGFLALLLAGLEVSVVALIGFVLLTGVIVNNGIVLVDYINQIRREGVEKREAIVSAGVIRMRPILMTSITTILGLIVMAFGKDAGTALMQPVALVCIGGLVYATLMTLFVVPCMYDLMNRGELRNVTDDDLKMLDM